ncbi:hypothetical protein PLICRDRAFT_125956 [Plicaturopsis crispa FD-325 SS-3]|nr:hypothetical protein PLICRDRAFT_125956 [Plicaturopsis crispa FD-325 SS-3]
MPKDPETLKALRSTRTPSGSSPASSSPLKVSRKSRTPKVTLEPVDQSLWRESKISPGSKTNKTKAMAQYRLQSSDIAELAFETTETVVTLNGQQTIRAMYLYDEREVEVVAWKKHGGPAGFQAHLDKCRVTWEKKNSAKPDFKKTEFVQPDVYDPRYGQAYVEVLSDIHLVPQHGGDPFVTTPKLLRLKPTFPPWLWEACNKAFTTVDQYPSLRNYRHEVAIACAQAQLGPYPPRPSAVLPSSTSVDALRAVLSRAPALRESHQMYPDAEDGVEYHEDFTGDIDYYWNEPYLNDLFNALIAVIEEHGVGNSGWRNVRWEVYDKYAECLYSGIVYRDPPPRYGYKWYDGAHDWLRGYITPRPNYLSTRRDEFSEAGEIYNTMLPKLSASE